MLQSRPIVTTVPIVRTVELNSQNQTYPNNNAYYLGQQPPTFYANSFQANNQPGMGQIQTYPLNNTYFTYSNQSAPQSYNSNNGLIIQDPNQQNFNQQAAF